MSNLNTISLNDVPTPLPSKELQDQFSERLRCIEELIFNSSQSFCGFDTLFSSLQHRVFREEGIGEELKA